MTSGRWLQVQIKLNTQKKNWGCNRLKMLKSLMMARDTNGLTKVMKNGTEPLKVHRGPGGKRDSVGSLSKEVLKAYSTQK